MNEDQWIKRESEFIKTQGWKRKFFLVNDIKIHAVIADSALKNSPIMILLHGFPEFWYSWRFVMPELSKHFHLVVPDQRGYNLSDKPRRVSNYYLKSLVEDIVEIIKKESEDYYGSISGLSKDHEYITKPMAVLVGHDWGGGVAWQIARWYPQVVRKLIIINCPPADILFNEALQNVNQLKKSYYVFAFQIPVVAELFFSKFKPIIFSSITKTTNMNKEERSRDKKAYLGAFSYKHAESALNWYRAAFRYSLLDLLGKRLFKPRKKIEIETKILWGTADLALGVELVRHFPKVVNPKKLSITFLVKKSHWVPQEAPQIVLEEIMACTKNLRKT